MNPALLAFLISEAIQIVTSAVSKGTITAPDAAPAIQNLINGLGHATGETDAERATRQANADAIFAKHNVSLLSPTPGAPKP